MYNYEIENIKLILERKLDLKDFRINEREIKRMLDMIKDYQFLNKKYEVMKELYLLK